MKTLFEITTAVLLSAVFFWIFVTTFEKDQYNFNRNAAQARAERMVEK